ncbi:MAG: DUF4252 domain-containing protein [Terriglobales bacterium]
MKRARWIGAVVLAVASAGALAAQQNSVTQEGRIQLTFNGLEHRAAEVNEVTLDGPMLQLGIRMLSASESDAQARQVLAQLKGVYIKSFHFDGDGKYSARDLDDIRRQLRAPGWAHILSVHSRTDHEDVDVYVMSGAQGVAGMTIIAAYPKELQVANLVGPIDPAALSRLGGHFGIPRVETNKKHEAQGGDAARSNWSQR